MGESKQRKTTSTESDSKRRELSNDEEMASSLFDELVKKYQLSKSFNILGNKDLDHLMNQLYEKDKIQNYYLFFIVLFLAQESNRKIFKKYDNFLNNIKNSKNLIEHSSLFYQKFQIDKIKKLGNHLYMINIFTQLNKEQKEDILSLGYFILNHKENDKLWNEYKELIKDVKTFLSRL